MARIRTIKPEFWDDEKLSELPYAARLLFIATWNFADDAGVIKASPAYLKAKAFPYDGDLRVTEITKWCDALVKARMLIPVSFNKESYYVIRTFRSHQIIDKRYERFILKGPDNKPVNIDSLCKPDDNTKKTHSEHIVATGQEMEGKGNGRERKDLNINPHAIFFKIRDQVIQGKVSEWLLKNKQIFLNEWEHRNKAAPIKEVFERLDVDYLTHEFGDENHIVNSLKATYDKIIKEKKNYGNSSSKGRSTIAAPPSRGAFFGDRGAAGV